MNEGLRETPLAPLHVRLGARLVPFAGFSMPVQYSSIVAEHTAARERAALFDVSHMGQLWVRGAGAGAALDQLLTRSVSDLAPGRVRYALLCNERAGTLDDLTAYRTGEQEWMLCVNAANTAGDREWIAARLPGDAQLEDASETTGLLAIQGPASSAVLAELAGPGVSELKRFRFGRFALPAGSALVSRTGYTGADGFEIYCEAGSLEPNFERLLEIGAGAGLLPAGLGARDTLRLEAALPLHGHELDPETTPLEAGLERFVELERDFVGAEALRRQHDRGLERTLAGFEVSGRGVARADCEVRVDGKGVGRVTSGAPSPTLGRPIGLAYLPPALAEPGTALDIAVRGREISARVVPTPFVRGERAGRRRPERSPSPKELPWPTSISPNR